MVICLSPLIRKTCGISCRSLVEKLMINAWKGHRDMAKKMVKLDKKQQKL